MLPDLICAMTLSKAAACGIKRTATCEIVRRRFTRRAVFARMIAALISSFRPALIAIRTSARIAPLIATFRTCRARLPIPWRPRPAPIELPLDVFALEIGVIVRARGFVDPGRHHFQVE